MEVHLNTAIAFLQTFVFHTCGHNYKPHITMKLDSQ